MLSAARELYGGVAVDQRLMQGIEVSVLVVYAPLLIVESDLDLVLCVNPSILWVLCHTDLCYLHLQWQ
jgi:hypothetical protein